MHLFGIYSKFRETDYTSASEGKFKPLMGFEKFNESE